jgi:hypothetical protein
MTLFRLVTLGLSLVATSPVWADEAKITWYDVSCRYMLVELPEGFGLYEWRSGADPKVDDAISGDIAGGPEIDATLKSTGEKMSLIHWGDAKKIEPLLRAAPRGCLNKPKKK